MVTQALLDLVSGGFKNSYEYILWHNIVEGPNHTERAPWFRMCLGGNWDRTFTPYIIPRILQVGSTWQVTSFQ